MIGADNLNYWPIHRSSEAKNILYYYKKVISGKNKDNSVNPRGCMWGPFSSSHASKIKKIFPC